MTDASMLTGDIHHTPYTSSDERQHDRSRNCWCLPDYTVDVGGCAIVRHRPIRYRAAVRP